MNDGFYKKALDQAIRDLSDAMSKRDDLDVERDDLDKQIDKLRDGVFGLSRLCGSSQSKLVEQYPELFPDLNPDMGLTDGVRNVLKSALSGRDFITPIRVRDKLAEAGYDVDSYKNLLSTIHTILKRLHRNGEVRTGLRDGKTTYMWNAAADSPKGTIGGAMTKKRMKV